MSDTVRRLMVVVLIVALGACDRSIAVDTVPGRVASSLTGEHLVEFGHWWTAHRSTARVAAVRNDGTFTVPAWANAVTVFVDRDGDGLLTGRTEPAAPCFREAGSWSCNLYDRVLRVSRIDSADLRHAGATDLAGNHVVALDSFTSNAERIEESMCETGTSACAAKGMDPFGGAGDPSVAFSPCDVSRLNTGSTLSLTIGNGPASGSHVVVEPVPSLIDGGTEGTVKLDVATGELTIRLRQPADRVVAWPGDESASRLDWSTEEDPDRVEVREEDVTFHLREPLRGDCAPGRCKLMVQVLRFARVPRFGSRSAEVRLATSMEAR